MIKELPILFSGPMVRAILEGRKTQTRRVVKPQECVEDLSAFGAPVYVHAARCEGACDYDCIEQAPYGQPGDFLWVKETHAVDVPGCDEQGGISYRADHQDPRGDGPAHPMKWIPSIFMRREFSRIDLEITGVRVERVQDISTADIQAEGVELEFCRCGSFLGHCDGHDSSPADFGEFRDLWDSINAEPTAKYRGGEIHHYESFPWNLYSGETDPVIRTHRGRPWIITTNPWVWVVEFKRIEVKP